MPTTLAILEACQKLTWSNLPLNTVDTLDHLWTCLWVLKNSGGQSQFCELHQTTFMYLKKKKDTWWIIYWHGVHTYYVFINQSKHINWWILKYESGECHFKAWPKHRVSSKIQIQWLRNDKTPLKIFAAANLSGAAVF